MASSAGPFASELHPETRIARPLHQRVRQTISHFVPSSECAPWQSAPIPGPPSPTRNPDAFLAPKLPNCRSTDRTAYRGKGTASPARQRIAPGRWVYSCAWSCRTKKAEPPPTCDANRDSGTASANSGWLRRLVRRRHGGPLHFNAGLIGSGTRLNNSRIR